MSSYTKPQKVQRASVFAFKFVVFVIIFVLSVIIFDYLGRSFFITKVASKLENGYAYTSLKAYNESIDGVQAPIKHRYDTVILDAGHGGEDGGAVSGEVVEKDLNLKIANLLYAVFSLSDITPVMTRDCDKLLYGDGEDGRKKFFDLKNRVKFAEKYENALFVSIHQNKFEIPKYHGFQVYYSKNAPESEALAEMIRSGIRRDLQPENKRECKGAGREIRVLNELSMPAVLCECGFISNPSEAKLLCDGNYQKKLAFSIFASVIGFISQ